MKHKLQVIGLLLLMLLSGFIMIQFLKFTTTLVLQPFFGDAMVAYLE